MGRSFNVHVHAGEVVTNPAFDDSASEADHDEINAENICTSIKVWFIYSFISLHSVASLESGNR